MQCLEEAVQQAEVSGDVPPPPFQIFSQHPFVCFSILSFSILSLLGRAQDPRANGAWLSKLTE